MPQRFDGDAIVGIGRKLPEPRNSRLFFRERDPP